MPIVAIVLPVLLGVAGLGVDAGSWMFARRDLQTAADAAALAGTWEMARGGNLYIDSAALKEAQNNGYKNADGDIITVTPDYDDESVTVEIQQQAQLYLTRIIRSDPVITTVQATAQITGLKGNFCILALNDSDSGSLSFSGTVELSMPDCGIAANSSDDSALIINGNVDITVEDVVLTGDYDINGGSADFNYDSIDTGAAPIQDPYADTALPVVGACDYNNYQISGGGSYTLNPGVYCGGLRISGNNDITFNPGVYIMDRGDLDVIGNGSLYGEEVAFFFTGSGNNYGQLKVTGGKTVEFSAPQEPDDLAGFVFFQDPDAPTNGNISNMMTGNADILIDGVMYFPSQEINFGGTSDTESDICTKVVGNFVVLHGTPFLGNDCSDEDAQPFGPPLVELVN